MANRVFQAPTALKKLKIGKNPIYYINAERMYLN